MGSRLAIVLSHPTQYYSPWFRWMAVHHAVELRVFYLWDFGATVRRDPQFERSFRWDVDLLSGYDHEFVRNVAKTPGTERFTGLWNPTVFGRIASWRPSSILLFGYRYATHLALIAWASARHLPLLFRGDSHLLGRDRPGFLRTRALRSMLSKFAAVTYVGAANRAYFRAFGVREARLHNVPHAVDHDLFDPSNPAYRAEAERLRNELRIVGLRTLLFAGKFSESKQPMELLRAFLSLDRTDCALVFVGDGPEGDALRREASLHSRATVRFLPFANQSEMPSRYLLGDVFVLPSRGEYETWGLAVNEAMHMGVPCVVSDRVGCQQDLVIAGETGWVFRADDAADLRANIESALDADGLELDRLGENARRRIARFGYREATAGLLDALRAADPSFCVGEARASASA